MTKARSLTKGRNWMQIGQDDDLRAGGNLGASCVADASASPLVREGIGCFAESGTSSSAFNKLFYAVAVGSGIDDLAPLIRAVLNEQKIALLAFKA